MDNRQYKTRSERIKELTDRLEAGITEVFTSGRYAEYLKTMSKFHRYSFRNTLLILMQCPTATHIAGYHDWRKKFGRQVKAGEHGITILAPCSRKQIEEVEEAEEDGKSTTAVKLTERRFYRAVTVFDVSQTEGRELPEICHDLVGDVEQYQTVFDTLCTLAAIPVSFEPLPEGVRGMFQHDPPKIALCPDMSQVDTLATLIHEIAHSRLHRRAAGEAPDKDRRTREVEAESVAYVVCQHFGIDTSDKSFGYVAGWSSGRELNELAASLETIRAAAAEMIDSIERDCPFLTAPELTQGEPVKRDRRAVAR